MYMPCCFFASRIAIILFLYLYMYFYRLAVNKSCSIFKMLATSGCLTGVQCTKFVSVGALPGPHWGSLQRSPHPPAGLMGPYF